MPALNFPLRPLSPAELLKVAKHVQAGEQHNQDGSNPMKTSRAPWSDLPVHQLLHLTGQVRQRQLDT